MLDIDGYDHVLFLIALAVPYTLKDWRRILLLVTLFTLGHTVSLVLSVFGILMIRADIVEFLIPLTILVTALYNLFTAGKNKSSTVNVLGFVTFFFGIIHGLGFSNYFRTILPGAATDKLVPLLSFAIGIELAQLIVVLVVLLTAFVLHHFGRFSKRDFALVSSAFITGVVLPMIAGSEIWN